MVTKTESELQAATGVKPKAKEARQSYLKRLNDAVGDLDDKTWKALSTQAMSWANAAAKVFNEGKGDPIADFEAPAPKAPGKKAAPEPDDAADEDQDDEDEDEDQDEEDDSETEDQDAEEAPASKKDKAMSGKTTKTSKKAAPKAAAKTPAKKGVAAPNKASKPPKAKADKKPTAAAKGAGYKGHREGSRKEQVHKAYDDKGKDAALKKADALDIQTATARAWVSSWGPSPADGGKTKK